MKRCDRMSYFDCLFLFCVFVVIVFLTVFILHKWTGMDNPENLRRSIMTNLYLKNKLKQMDMTEIERLQKKHSTRLLVNRSANRKRRRKPRMKKKHKRRVAKAQERKKSKDGKHKIKKKKDKSPRKVMHLTKEEQLWLHKLRDMKAAHMSLRKKSDDLKNDDPLSLPRHT
ncbi:uncharacterized protein LOC143030383 [Oratosquilla oratoria]|uniref:uncharacterized protein LOC143030383 n=1 Tax=Oratosquilla oratoria TaxID=337810 RepID=UPI003F760303